MGNKREARRCERRRKKASEKRVLRGVCKLRKEEKENILAVDNYNHPLLLDMEQLHDQLSESDEPSDMPCEDTVLNPSASERKILNTSAQENNGLLPERATEGYILMDIGRLCDFLNQNMKCSICGNHLRTFVDQSLSDGFANQVFGECEVCESMHQMFTTSGRCSEYSSNCTPFEVNMRMMSYVRSISKGHNAMDKFATHLNMPHSLSQKAYDRLSNHLHNSARQVAMDSICKAAQDL